MSPVDRNAETRTAGSAMNPRRNRNPRTPPNPLLTENTTAPKSEATNNQRGSRCFQSLVVLEQRAQMRQPDERGKEEYDDQYPGYQGVPL